MTDGIEIGPGVRLSPWLDERGSVVRPFYIGERVNQQPVHPRVTICLSAIQRSSAGERGHVLTLIAWTSNALAYAGVSRDEIVKFRNEAGTADDPVAVCRRWVNVT